MCSVHWSPSHHLVVPVLSGTSRQAAFRSWKFPDFECVGFAGARVLRDLRNDMDAKTSAGVKDHKLGTSSREMTPSNYSNWTFNPRETTSEWRRTAPHQHSPSLRRRATTTAVPR